MILIQVCYFLCFCVYFHEIHTLTCKDVSNKPVDWFIIYKLPEIKNDLNKWVREGLGQIYLDSNDQNFQLLNTSIGQQTGPVYYSLSNIYGKKNDSLMYAMYNDQLPVKGPESKGHTKGVISFDETSGLWLIHSIPKFPPSPANQFSYPSTATTFGQTLLCISMSYKLLNLLGLQLRYNDPNIYKYFLPNNMKNSNPNMVLALASNGSKISGKPYFNVAEFTSLKGEKFLSFAKNADFNKDLYSNLVATKFQSDLLVETWRRGQGNMDSECNMHYKVENIKSIKILKRSFNTTCDHSKWTITSPAKVINSIKFKVNPNKRLQIRQKNRYGVLKMVVQNTGASSSSSPSPSSLAAAVSSKWICIGDINRQEHQLVRGGGTMCLSKEQVWNNFKQLITSVEKC